MDELKKILLDSVDDDSIPNLSNSIKAIYKDRVSKRIPWYKKKLTYQIGVPALAGLACVAIILPITVTKNDKGSLIPIINNQLAATETAYGVSTLSLANAISFNAELLGNVSTSLKARQNSNQEYTGGWGGWSGWQYINENDLRDVLKDMHPYMYVADKMLKDDLKVSPDVFKHISGKGYEEYECVFNKDLDFECSFDFKEKLTGDKARVVVNGELGVSKEKFTVEGIRNNVTKDENAEVNLNVKFDNNEKVKPWYEQKNPTLSFIERTDENDNTCYKFVYSEKSQTMYEIELKNQFYDDGFGTKFPWVEVDVTKYKAYTTPYFPGGWGVYYQPQSYVFSVERGMDGKSLNLYLFGFGQKLFINVLDNNGSYYYYLWDYNTNDPFDNHSKH